MNNEFLLLSGALRVFNDFSKTTYENFMIEHDTENVQFELLRKTIRF